MRGWLVEDATMDDGFEEFDEDGLVDSDDDDNSWKVRRAALKARITKARGSLDSEAVEL